jgi:uncharacterized protein
MIDRPIWLRRLDDAWAHAPIVWLAGVRRSGKTTLARSLGTDGVIWLNCDLPAVEAMVRNPASFFASCGDRIVVFDEVHQLRNPSRLLKIGADEFPGTRILATGSSTLAATTKFRDTLAGRKRTVHLTPVLWDELPAFGVPLTTRLLHGGLPQALLAREKDPGFYREWLDSFFARDIQRLFGFRSIDRFNTLFEYVLRQSGGQISILSTATALGITRPTVESHLRALEVTHAATVVRPFHGGHGTEFVKQPKIYAFDTGFVTFARGWDTLRPDDVGVLWEHLVLEHLQAHFPDVPVRFWRDRSGQELDFVLELGRDRVDIIECKWDPETFDARALRTFRSRYPKGRNTIVSPGASSPYAMQVDGLDIRVCTPSSLAP